MSYQVLARKWRPRNFATMVGQEHVLRAIINALDNERLHHAYLFTGTRGVGKTTIARIFAKSLNCEKGVTSQPCGVCSACREIDEGRFVDLIEVDAASRTKVEDTRELLENVQYSPTRGRYKVYLIDEVHMLSTHSFNALLKTLEEPPPHIKFLLATTDPQKLPVTILSRCLQFNLRRMAPEMIAGHLRYILEQEQIPADAAALVQIAEAADGSMRDALSLLDQAIAYGAGRLEAAEVRAMLGSIDRGRVLALVRALAERDAAAVLQVVHDIAQQGVDFAAVLAEILSLLHQIALAQWVPQAVAQSSEAEAVTELARRITPEDVQLYYQIGLIGRRDLPLAPDGRSGLEMVLLRMLAFQPEETETPRPAAAPAPRSIAPAPAPAPAAPRPVSSPGANAAPASSAAPQPLRPAANPASDWPAIVEALGVQGVLRQLAANAVMTGREGDVIHLQLAPQHASLRSRALEVRLQEALQKYFGAPVKLNFTEGVLSEDTPANLEQKRVRDRQAAAVAAIQADPNVQRLREAFNAEVVKDSIQPLE